MTFGIDIASSQRDINLMQAKAEGVEFVIVKMGGFNVTPQYVAPHYRAQIDRAISAGLAKGHYYLIGAGQTPEAQADFFVKNLHRFDLAHDVLALDNEHLDANGTRWGDADAARFVRRVIALTGIPAHRVWHYAGAQDYRATGAWHELEALGVRFWWAAYGDYPTGQTPDHTPSLGGSIPLWDVHQFTSRSDVAGFAVDGNYSPHSINVLFGGEVATEAQIRSWIAGYPRAWDQLCQALMWQLAKRFGTVRSTPVSAILAYHVERQAERMRTGTPPPGSFVYWDIGEFGHVGYVMNGGRVLMATRHLSEHLVSSNAGWGTVANYSRATGADYLGWSYQNGGNTVPFSTSSVAGGGGTIIEEDELSAEAERKIAWIHQMLAYGGTAGGKTFNYGVLPIVGHNQTLIAGLYAQVKALADVVRANGAPVDIDLDAIRQAAEEGAASSKLSDDDLARLASLIAVEVVSQLPEDADPAAIAEAVRAKFRSEPLA